jgi:hypothetical protein
LAGPQRHGRHGRHHDDDAGLRARATAQAASARAARLRRQPGAGQDRGVGDAPATDNDSEDHELGLLLRWSYGSAFGIAHGLLRRRLPEPWASAAFGGILMSATLSLFPLLGRTPPPWRWGPGMIASSFGTHAAYVTAVAVVDHQVLRRTR